MKKLFFTAVLILMLLFALNVTAEQIFYNNEYHDYNGGEIGLKVDGMYVGNLPMNPVIINDYTMVPVREVFEALGCKIIWHNDTQQVEIVDHGSSVFIRIGDRNTVVNGKTIPIEEPQPLPMLIGRSPEDLKSMVPVRFVAEKLGFEVLWNGETKTVSVNRKEASLPAGDGKEDDEKVLFSSISGKSDSKYDYVYITTSKGVSPKIYRYVNPERIVFDFPNTRFDSPSGGLNIKGNCVETARYSNHEEYGRLVFDIAESTQVMVLKTKDGMLLRAEKSPNTQIVYDAFLKKVYFDKNYAGNGKKTSNGYSVTFSNIKMQDQKIEINDEEFSEIVISNSASGCNVTVSGGNNITYTAEKAFHKSNTAVETEKPNVNVSGKPVVVIDAGHGGDDPGAISQDQSGKIIARESHINLAIALALGNLLENNGVEVVYTRNKDNYISLQERSELANSIECDLFVSIHCNSIEKPEINGTQVYYHPSSEVGTYLAENIYKNILKMTTLQPKNTQNGAHLFVIRSTTAPAVLVETAFISNESDRNFLLNTANQEKMANAIFQGIMQTLNNK